MFMGAEALTTLDVSGWDTSSMTNMDRMFSNAESLTVLDVSGWNTGNVINMQGVFHNVGGVSVLDVSNWDTRNATNMASMFNGASAVSVLDVSGWDTSNVTTMTGMFRYTEALTGLDVSGWNTGNVTTMSTMFMGASALTALDVSGWETERVTSMSGMFRETALTSLDVSSWDTGRVTDMSTMFMGAGALTSLDVSNWDTSRVISMDRMFSGAGALTALDVSDWEVGNVRNMQGVFHNAAALTVLDVSAWNTRSATIMASMFQGASNVSVLDVSNWDTSNVANMSGLFRETAAVTELDMTAWDTSSVTTMSSMFFGTGVTHLDLSRWNVNNVTNMSSMFRGATNLTSLDLLGWNTSNVTTMADMFHTANSLRRITFGADFVNGTLTNPRLPVRSAGGGFTGLWLNISTPDDMTAIPSDELLPTNGGGPHSAGIWVWQRQPLGVAMTVYPSYHFQTLALGYTPQQLIEHDVTVVNIGMQPIGVPLTITMTGNEDAFMLNGSTANNFTIDDGLPLDGYFTFAIVPKLELAPGTYSAVVTITGDGVNTESFTVFFTVIPNSIENAVITFVDDAEFNGNPQRPALVVTLDGEVLVEGRDFEIESWDNDIRARNYDDTNPPTVTIIGINDFADEGSVATRPFTIRRRPVTLTRGSFSVTKVYDGTNSSVGATTTGSLALGNLATNDSLRVRVDRTDIGDFGADVGEYETTLFGLSLVSIDENDDWHLNYDLGIVMLTEIPARITEANFPSPIPSIDRTVATGAVRTITIPISELTPLPPAPMRLGEEINPIILHNYTEGPVSASAEIVDGYLIITTLQHPHGTNLSETINVRFDVLNFFPFDVQVNLATVEAESHTVSYEITSAIAPTNFTPSIPAPISRQQGAANIEVAPILMTDETANGSILGTWIFTGWTTTADIEIDEELGTFTMPASNVVFQGSWTFEPNEDEPTTFTINFLPETDGTISAAQITEFNGIHSDLALSAQGVTVPTVAANSGWDFVGWRIQNGGSAVFSNSQILAMQRNGATTFVAAYNPRGGDNWLGGASRPPIGVWTPPAPNRHLLYVIGYSSGDFRPDTNITRAEIAAIGSRIHFENFTPGAAANFPDVDGVEWFTNYVGFAQQRGMLQGFPNGNFEPHRNMTRAEFSAMIARFSGFSPYGTTDWFSDISGHWAEGYINTLTIARPGTVSGYADGTFRPDAPITRAEAVTIINRVLGRGVDAAGLANVAYRSFSDTVGHWAYFEVIEASNSHEFAIVNNAERWTRIWQEIWWID